ncbi:hypothetical protein ACOI1C_21640 [Bacillus sp. DJP31]|uniref:hypothetical protein n=1 Tax=Bacillus sp. DJP31 TaxID=3409789 RepID=UPI003BB798C5
MRQYKKWYLYLIICSLISIICIIIFCFMIDPYKIYNTPTIKHYNLKKIESKEYLMKARQVATNKPEVIFLGSSRTRLGLDPDYYYQATGEIAYNIGLSGANIYEQMRYFDYALKSNPNLKRVIIGLDYEGFNTYRNNTIAFVDSRLDTHLLIKEDLLSTLLSEQSLKDSIKVFIDNIKDEQKYTRSVFLPNGSHNESEIVIRNEVLLKNGRNPFYEHLNEHLNNEEILKNYKLSDQKLQNFIRLVNLCEVNNIKLDVFLPPVHAIQLEGIRKAGLWNDFERWKKEIVAITPVWDFFGYNSITTKPPINFEFYTDQSHYRKNVGNLIFNSILDIHLDAVPGDFGIILTKENIDLHLKAIREDRRDWAESNPGIVRKINEL